MSGCIANQRKFENPRFKTVDVCERNAYLRLPGPVPASFYQAAVARALPQSANRAPNLPEQAAICHRLCRPRFFDLVVKSAHVDARAGRAALAANRRRLGGLCDAFSSIAGNESWTWPPIDKKSNSVRCTTPFWRLMANGDLFTKIL